MARRHTNPYSPRGVDRDQIARIASDLVTEGGFSQLSLRALASRLGVAAPSLYEHVRDKDDVIDLVVDQILAKEEASWAPPADWQESVSYIAHWWYDLFLRQPEVLASVQRRPVTHPLALRTIESLLSVLTDAGFPRDTAVATYMQVFGFVIGMAGLHESRRVARVSESVDELEARKRILELLQDMPADYPILQRHANDFADVVSEHNFETGLSQIVKGLEARVGRSKRRRVT
jgi:AcrR family transcriptional regulator